MTLSHKKRDAFFLMAWTKEILFLNMGANDVLCRILSTCESNSSNLLLRWKNDAHLSDAHLYDALIHGAWFCNASIHEVMPGQWWMFPWTLIMTTHEWCIYRSWNLLTTMMHIRMIHLSGMLEKDNKTNKALLWVWYIVNSTRLSFHDHLCSTEMIINWEIL